MANRLLHALLPWILHTEIGREFSSWWIPGLLLGREEIIIIIIINGLDCNGD